MKYCRRMACAALAAVLAAGMVIPASAAKVGTVIGHALHTNIVAQINGHALRSYNVNNRTAVVAEDLARYGFKVTWDDGTRTLSVERDMDEKGNVKDPRNYPPYEKEELLEPAGSPAESILATDIVAYVAGEQVESFNIDGETLIWLSDLSRYGTVTWDAEKWIANVELGNPMELALSRVIEPLVQWAGEKAEYQLFKGENGTLFVGYYYGTPHGTACVMEYVDKAGKRTNIDQLLPPNGFGAKYYVRPRNILLGAERLTFTTTFQEGSDGVQADEWRDHVMIVDLKTGTLLYTQRAEQVDKKLTQWSYDFKPAADAQFASDQILELKVQKQAGSDQLVLLESSLPYSGIEIQLSNNKAVVFVGNRTNDSYQSTPYGKAYYSLAKSNLPSVFRAEELGLPFISGNNLQQRKYVRTVFQVLVDDEYVNGALSWRGKNGKRCLWYEFDHNLDLVDGQIITVKMGMPL